MTQHQEGTITVGAMQIQPCEPDTPMASHRTGTLTHITGQEIIQRLGFEPARDVTPESSAEWRFRANGHDCSIWDMKGSGRNCIWSTHGPQEVFAALFGWRAVR